MPPTPLLRRYLVPNTDAAGVKSPRPRRCLVSRTSQKVYRLDIWADAAKELVSEGKLAATDLPATDGYKAPTNEFIDVSSTMVRNLLNTSKNLPLATKTK